MLQELYTRFKGTQKAVKSSGSSRNSDVGGTIACALWWTESHDDIERLLTSERFICRQCLLKLQRLQKLKKDVVDLRANIVGSMEASQIPPQPAESSAEPTSSCVLGKWTSSQEIIPPPAKRALVTSPAARRQLQFSVAPPEMEKSPSVTVHT